MCVTLPYAMHGGMAPSHAQLRGCTVAERGNSEWRVIICDVVATALRRRSDVAATNARRISEIAETSLRCRSGMYSAIIMLYD